MTSARTASACARRPSANAGARRHALPEPVHIHLCSLAGFPSASGGSRAASISPPGRGHPAIRSSRWRGPRRSNSTALMVAAVRANPVQRRGLTSSASKCLGSNRARELCTTFSKRGTPLWLAPNARWGRFHRRRCWPGRLGPGHPLAQAARHTYPWDRILSASAPAPPMFRRGRSVGARTRQLPLAVIVVTSNSPAGWPNGFVT